MWKRGKRVGVATDDSTWVWPLKEGGVTTEGRRKGMATEGGMWDVAIEVMRGVATEGGRKAWHLGEGRVY